ncbi:hypothetical protein [Paenibacillus lautus]|uniref:hypothetical protein n=1 Tax=Paenibacillus lautus TaxID=1401 RepID=UPI003D2B2F81
MFAAIAHGLIKKNSIPIAATHLDTGEQFEFASQSEASRTLFVSMNKIYDVLNGRLAHVCGWIFKYLDDSRVEQQIALSEREQHPYAKNRSVF